MDPLSIILMIGSVVTGVPALAVMLGVHRHRKNKRAAERWENQVKQELSTERLRRYEEYQRARIEQGRKRAPADEVLEAIEDPEPFDPLDPNTDKGWCQACDQLHPIADMKFPPDSVLWLCPDCYGDYMDPEAVLNPPESPLVIISPEEPRQDPADDGLIDTIAAMAQIPPAQMSRDFQCYMCEGQFASSQAVPPGPVLCQHCVARARRRECPYCGNSLAIRIFGIYDDQFVCGDCIQRMDQPVTPSGTGSPPKDELAEKRHRKRQSGRFPTMSDRDTYQLKKEH